MIRRPPRSTRDRSSAASDVYKRQVLDLLLVALLVLLISLLVERVDGQRSFWAGVALGLLALSRENALVLVPVPVSYTHLRAHETVLDLVCRLLLEKKTQHTTHNTHCNLNSTNISAQRPELIQCYTIESSWMT